MQGRGKITASLWRRVQAGLNMVAVLGMMAIFGIFIFAMRHAGHPQSWVDEVMTVLTAWMVFLTSAFVLKWQEFIAFDMVFRLIPPRARRLSMIAGALCFVGVFAAVFWQLVDCVRFMRILTTDMVRLPLDLVYAIFPVFIAAMMLRLAILAARLAFGDHEAALAELSGMDPAGEVRP